MALIGVRVAEIIDEAPTIKSIRFVRADGKPLGIYQAGQGAGFIGAAVGAILILFVVSRLKK